MKKLLSILLLAMLVVFMGCDSSGDTAASAEEQAMAEQLAQSFGISMKAMVPTGESGVEPIEGLSKAAASGFTANSGTISGSYTMPINETSGTTTVTGSLTLTIVSGSYTATTYDINATFTGNITAVSDGVTYNLTFALTMSLTESSSSVSGYVTVNGAKADIQVSI